MKKIPIFAGVALALMTGCMSTNTNDGATPVSFAVAKAYTADVDVQKEATQAEATVNCLFGLITWGVSEYADDAFVTSNTGLGLFKDPATVAKQGATYKACDATKADYLLGATYRIDTQDYFIFKTVKCTATGYPATVKGVKEAK